MAQVFSGWRVDGKEGLRALSLLAVLEPRSQEPPGDKEARQLRETGRLAQSISDTLSDAIVLATPDGIITHWNPAAETMFGWKASEALGRPLSIFIPERFHAAHDAGMARVSAGGATKLFGKPVEIFARRRSGEELPVELSLARWAGDEKGRPTGYAAVIRDMSERRRLRDELQESRAFLDAIIDNLPSMLFVKDAVTGTYEVFNRAGETLTGRSRDAVLGHTDAELFPSASEGYRERDAIVSRTGEVTVFESDFERDDGEVLRVRTKRVLMEGKVGAPVILGIADDVTEQHRANRRIAYLASHDPLTALRNRSGVEDDFRSLREGLTTETVAMLAVDIDRFKAVNDLYGQSAGDCLLTAFAERLRTLLPQDAVAARIGSDEFLVLIPGRYAGDRAARFAAAVAAASANAFTLAGRKVYVSTSIGIALAEADDHDFDACCRNADRALARTKQQGRGGYSFFNPEMDEAATRRREMEVHLRAAIEADRIRLHFQPLVSLQSGRVEGFEALARWDHPEQGPVSPETFIPIAEESGLIVKLGRNVLSAAIKEAAGWAPPLHVAVNLSPAQFEDESLVPTIRNLLVRNDFAPARLVLEVTENLLIRDTAKALATLNELRSLGVRIAMDDFGTGYSSLAYFRMFPFDKVKIDRTFIHDMEDDPQALAIVQAIIGLGHGLGLSIVAEGVESDQQVEMLRNAGCTLIQGFHIGRPAPIEHFEGVVVTRGTEAETPSSRKFGT